MKVTTMKKISVLKKTLINKWYFCMKPIATLIKKIDSKKSAKKYDRIKNMTLEEVIKIYVKYTVKYMIKQKDSVELFYCCTKKNGYAEYYDDHFILSDLNRIGYSRFSNTKIYNWYYVNKDCQSIKYGDEGKVKWIELENKLRLLAEAEFIRIGCKVDYIDETDKLDAWFVKDSGYEKTMRVTIN